MTEMGRNSELVEGNQVKLPQAFFWWNFVLISQDTALINRYYHYSALMKDNKQNAWALRDLCSLYLYHCHLLVTIVLTVLCFEDYTAKAMFHLLLIIIPRNPLRSWSHWFKICTECSALVYHWSGHNRFCRH